MLLGNFGLKFHICPANIEECIPLSRAKSNEKIIYGYANLVKKLAYDKAVEVSRRYKGIIIGADTIVVIGKNVLVKPKNNEDAKRMLRLLSNKYHRVYTGLAILDTHNKKVFRTYDVTKVKFRKLNKREIDFYVRTGTPLDKAGAYGIQDDFSCTFAEKIVGDYFNVVGLPVVKTYLGLRKILDFESLVVPKI